MVKASIGNNKKQGGKRGNKNGRGNDDRKKKDKRKNAKRPDKRVDKPKKKKLPITVLGAIAALFRAFLRVFTTMFSSVGGSVGNIRRTGDSVISSTLGIDPKMLTIMCLCLCAAVASGEDYSRPRAEWTDPDPILDRIDCYVEYASLECNESLGYPRHRKSAMTRNVDGDLVGEFYRVSLTANDARGGYSHVCGGTGLICGNRSPMRSAEDARRAQLTIQPWIEAMPSPPARGLAHRVVNGTRHKRDVHGEYEPVTKEKPHGSHTTRHTAAAGGVDIFEIVNVGSGVVLVLMLVFGSLRNIGKKKRSWWAFIVTTFFILAHLYARANSAMLVYRDEFDHREEFESIAENCGGEVSCWYKGYFTRGSDVATQSAISRQAVLRMERSRTSNEYSISYLNRRLDAAHHVTAVTMCQCAGGGMSNATIAFSKLIADYLRPIVLARRIGTQPCSVFVTRCVVNGAPLLQGGAHAQFSEGHENATGHPCVPHGFKHRAELPRNKRAVQVQPSVLDPLAIIHMRENDLRDTPVRETVSLCEATSYWWGFLGLFGVIAIAAVVIKHAKFARTTTDELFRSDQEVRQLRLRMNVMEDTDPNDHKMYVHRQGSGMNGYSKLALVVACLMCCGIPVSASHNATHNSTRVLSAFRTTACLFGMKNATCGVIGVDGVFVDNLWADARDIYILASTFVALICGLTVVAVMLRMALIMCFDVIERGLAFWTSSVRPVPQERDDDDTTDDEFAIRVTPAVHQWRRRRQYRGGRKTTALLTIVMCVTVVNAVRPDSLVPDAVFPSSNALTDDATERPALAIAKEAMARFEREAATTSPTDEYDTEELFEHAGSIGDPQPEGLKRAQPANTRTKAPPTTPVVDDGNHLAKGHVLTKILQSTSVLPGGEFNPTCLSTVNIGRVEAQKAIPLLLEAGSCVSGEYEGEEFTVSLAAIEYTGGWSLVEQVPLNYVVKSASGYRCSHGAAPCVSCPRNESAFCIDHREKKRMFWAEGCFFGAPGDVCTTVTIMNTTDIATVFRQQTGARTLSVGVHGRKAHVASSMFSDATHVLKAGHTAYELHCKIAEATRSNVEHYVVYYDWHEHPAAYEVCPLVETSLADTLRAPSGGTRDTLANLGRVVKFRECEYDHCDYDAHLRFHNEYVKWRSARDCYEAVVHRDDAGLSIQRMLVPEKVTCELRVMPTTGSTGVDYVVCEPGEAVLTLRSHDSTYMGHTMVAELRNTRRASCVVVVPDIADCTFYVHVIPTGLTKIVYQCAVERHVTIYGTQVTLAGMSYVQVATHQAAVWRDNIVARVHFGAMHASLRFISDAFDAVVRVLGLFGIAKYAVFIIVLLVGVLAVFWFKNWLIAIAIAAAVAAVLAVVLII